MEAKKKILIVEDEKNIAQVLQYNIIKSGYDAEIAGDGGVGLVRALSGEFDLILLDIMLPVMNGFEVCEQIRQRSQVPIIFVTAREEEKDKILGLDTGADDYVTKPFSFKELLSRIRANIRRSAGETIIEKKTEESAPVTIGDLSIDCAKYLVTKGGEPIELSKKDYDLLAFLAANLGRAYSREELLEEIWGYENYYGDTRNVDVTVCRLRNKIEDDPSKPEYLMTKRGVGYYLRRP
ncbi:MAG: response regulator transcription factor [Clostridia bacterium]|jgi:two-component system response regulator VicR|nr:response regulator transcription factor [Clostridia bacterium]